ncbi:hypothetical protein [Xanthocytophaga flava]|uniref:hypothetical protein n=1 Tax=Xanthocytophaga flava TaxID=3048013 RepID=UPI0028D3896C|nr:hypothetical protein [Xanthocytophaga flavus]MDJ1473388.1 hypothetical protein [Xanthocytophaga flavus]
MKLMDISFRRYKIILVTLSLLALIFGVYYFVYVKENESYLHERAFRILSQINTNIIEKNANTIQNAKEEIKYRLDEIEKSLPAKGVYNQDITFTEINPYQEEDFIKTAITQHNFLHYTDTVGKSSNGVKSTIEFQVSLEDFLKNVLVGKGEVFDEFQLISSKQEGSVFSTMPGELSLYTDEGKAYQLDSLFKKSDNIWNVKLAGIPYKLFTQRIRINTDHDLILAGLILRKTYYAQIYEVPVFTLLFSLLLMLLLVLGYPFIKLLIVSPVERLKAEDAFLCALSVVIGSFLITIMVISSYTYFFPEKKANNEDLSKLNTDIRTAFIGELDAAVAQLEAYKIRKPKKTNLNILKKTTMKPLVYPYFDDVFWIDSLGWAKQALYVDTVDQPSVKVQDRNYFQAVLTNQLWQLGKGQSKRLFMFEPIFNRITGENIVAISIRADKSYLPTDPLNNYRPVMAMVAKLQSVINPIMPLGYQFSIIDPKGKVWFHSNQTKNLQEDFLKECGEDRELLAAINGSASRHLSITYNGEPYIAYGAPLPNLPLYLLVFHKQEYFNSTRTMAISMTILYFLLSLVPLFILLLTHKLTYQHDVRLKGENFAFYWLAPIQENTRSYVVFACLNILLIVLTILFSFSYQNETDLWCFYVLTSITSFALARYLYFKSTKPIFWIIYSLLSVLLITKISQQSADQAGVTKTVIILGYILGLLLVSLLTIFFDAALKLREEKLKLSEDKNESMLSEIFQVRKSYPWSMLFWAILLGVVPAILFYKVNYDREHRIAASHQLIHLAHQLTQRRIDIEKHYAKMRISENDSIVKKLIEQKGYYTQSIYPVTINYGISSTDSANKKSVISYSRFNELMPRLHLRPLYNKIVRDNHLLLKSDINLANFHWVDLTKKDILTVQYAGVLHDKSDISKSIQISCSLPSLNFPFLSDALNLPMDGWVVAELYILPSVIIAILLCGLFAIIRYSATHLFNFILFDEGLYNFGVDSHFNSKKCKDVVTSANTAASNYLFLSGSFLPNARYLSKLFDPKSAKNLVFINLSQLTEKDVKDISKGKSLKEVFDTKSSFYHEI